MAKVKRYIKPEEVELRLAEMRKGLFSNAASEMREVSLVWIPYYAWANRGIGEMRVWVHA